MGLSKRLRWLGVAACIAALGFMVTRLQSERAIPWAVQPSVAVESSPSVEDAALVDVTGWRAEPARSIAALQSPALIPEEAAPASVERWFRGRVLLANGLPAEEASVALVEWKDGSPVSNGQNERARADGLGQFALNVPGWAWERTVHLSARRDGSRPYSKTIRIDQAELALAHELGLEEGHAIEGRVLLAGQPLVDVYVGVDVAYGVAGIYGAGRESWWAGGRTEEKRGETTTDENGYFCVAGLSAAEHRVYLHEQAAPPSGLAAHLYAVSAPDTRVYDLTPATLRLTTLGPAGPLEGAEITVSLDHTQVKLTSVLTPMEVQVPPDQTVRVVVQHPSAEPLDQEVVAPAAGQWLDVSLFMQAIERPRLLVDVPGAEMNSLSLHLSKPTGADALVVEARRPTPEGVFVVEAVPLGPGVYHLSIEPGASGSGRSFLYPTACELELPPSGDVHAVLPLNWGGRCEVEVLSESEFESSASYELIDAEGRVCMTRTVTTQFEIMDL